MKTDKERLTDLLDSFGIDYVNEKRLGGESIVIDHTSARVTGLASCWFEFDQRGKFLVLEIEE